MPVGLIIVAIILLALWGGVTIVRRQFKKSGIEEEISNIYDERVADKAKEKLKNLTKKESRNT